MLNQLWNRLNRRRRNSVAFEEAIVPLESRLLLSASAGGKSHKHAATTQSTTTNYDGFWSGFAQTEAMNISQNGKRVTATFNAPSNWGIAGTTPINLLENAVGKGKVKGDQLHLVLKGEAHNSNTNEFGTAKLTFDESITETHPSYVKMTGTVKIQLDGRTYQADEFAIHYT